MTRPRRAALFATLAAATCALAYAGCAGRAEKPLKVAQPIDDSPTSGEEVALPTPGERPAQSDPAAMELVKLAVKAHAGDRPFDLAKFKAVKFTRKGLGRTPEENPLGQSWAVAMRFPGQFRARAEFANDLRPITVGLSGTTGWMLKDDPYTLMPMNAEEAGHFQTDITGEWVALLFPLIESESVFAAAPVPVGGVAHPGVRLFHPKLAPCLLYFDPATHTLARVHFEGRENGIPGRKEFQLLEFKPVEGVQFVSRLAQKFRGSQYADWSYEKVESAPGLDARAFEPPAK